MVGSFLPSKGFIITSRYFPPFTISSEVQKKKKKYTKRFSPSIINKWFLSEYYTHDSSTTDCICANVSPLSTDRPEHNCSRDNRQKYCTYQVQLDPNVEKTELQMGKRVGPRACVDNVQLTVKVLKVDGIWKKPNKNKNLQS